MIQSSKDDPVPNQGVITNVYAALILEAASGIDEYIFMAAWLCLMERSCIYSVISSTLSELRYSSISSTVIITLNSP